MANPNKTVAAFRRKCPIQVPPKPTSDFIRWFSEQVRSGVEFNSLEEAREAFNKATNGN